MLYYVALEILEERYTAQMFKWCLKAFAKRTGQVFTISPPPQENYITEGGQFLNWADRSLVCAWQNAKIARLFKKGKIKDGDKFFIADFWHPGVESIAYMAEMMDIDVEIYGINYAGPLDPTDLTHKLIDWGKYQEMTWYTLFDKVFVGSEFHRMTILNALKPYNYPVGTLSNKLVATGLVWDEEDVASTAYSHPHDDDPRPIVIWPHRISPDKNIEGFYEIVRAVKKTGRQVRWLITSSRKGQVYKPEMPEVEFKVVDKHGYYALLGRSAVMLSTAFHENFGYTVREATLFGTPVLCPERACYPEMIQSLENRYTHQSDAVYKILLALNNQLPVATLKKTRGIEHMLDEMGY